MSVFLKTIGISLRSATEQTGDSSTGKLTENMLAAFAQFDNDVKAERTKTGMKAALGHGRWTFQAPLGYLRNQAPKGQGNIIPDPERAPLIKKAFELYATALYARPQVLRMIHDLGLRTRKGNKISLQTFEDILKNSLYTGIMKTKLTDQPEEGHYEPIIEKALFYKVQDVLAGKKHTITPYQRNHPDFPLRQFVQCGTCSRPLTASWSKGRTKKYPYYRCPNSRCKAINVSKGALEKEFISHLEQLIPVPEYLNLLKAIVLDKWHDQEAAATAQSKSMQRCVDELRGRKDKLEEAFIYEKRISKATYDEQRDKLAEEIAIAEGEAHQAKLEALDVEGAFNFARYLASNPARIWMEMNLDQKQRFQKVLFPAGLPFLEGRFGTAATCIFFKVLQEATAPESRLASPRGFEPLLPG